MTNLHTGQQTLPESGATSLDTPLQVSRRKLLSVISSRIADQPWSSFLIACRKSFSNSGVDERVIKSLEFALNAGYDRPEAWESIAGALSALSRRCPAGAAWERLDKAMARCRLKQEPVLPMLLAYDEALNPAFGAAVWPVFERLMDAPDTGSTQAILKNGAIVFAANPNGDKLALAEDFLRRALQLPDPGRHVAEFKTLLETDRSAEHLNTFTAATLPPRETAGAVDPAICTMLLETGPSPSFTHLYLRCLNASKGANAANDLTAKFSAFLGPRHPAIFHQTLYEALDHQLNNGYAAAPVLDNFVAMAGRLEAGDRTRLHRTTRRFIKEGLDLNLLTGELFERVSDGRFEALAASLGALRRSNAEEGTKAALKNLAVEFCGLPDGERVLRKIGANARANWFSDLESATDFERAVKLNVAVSVLVRQHSADEQAWAYQVLLKVGRCDQPPYPRNMGDAWDANAAPHPAAKRVFEQSLAVFRRLMKVHLGFSRWTYDARQHWDEEVERIPIPLAQFGMDCASSVQMVNAADPNRAPGRGVLIEGFLPQNAFLSDQAIAKGRGRTLIGRHKPSFDFIKHNMPWAADEIDDLPGTRVIFLRGAIVVTGPRGNEKYRLQKQHYSYIVFNEHFENPLARIGCLVPSELIDEKIEGTTIPLADFVGFGAGAARDINDRDFRLVGFREAASKKTGRPNVLEFNPVIITGGLCDAYPPYSEPYYDWERFRTDIPFRDIGGHVHKAFITGEYSNEISPAMDRMLQPLRRAHEEVYLVTAANQVLLDLVNLQLSYWHKGQTRHAQEEESLSAPELEVSRPGEVNLGPDAVRMLQSAVHWHLRLHAQHASRSQFPILVTAPWHDYMNASTVPLLDSYDLSLMVPPKSKFPLERGVWSEQAEHFYIQHIAPRLTPSTDLRLVDRSQVNIRE